MAARALGGGDALVGSSLLAAPLGCFGAYLAGSLLLLLVGWTARCPLAVAGAEVPQIDNNRQLEECPQRERRADDVAVRPQKVGHPCARYVRLHTVECNRRKSVTPAHAAGADRRARRMGAADIAGGGAQAKAWADATAAVKRVWRRGLGSGLGLGCGLGLGLGLGRGARWTKSK